MNDKPLNNDQLDPAAKQAARGGWTAHVLLLAGVCAALFLLNAKSLPLSDPEESRCGMIVRDMMQHGNWLAPHLQGEMYYDKPAPFFWLAAASVRLTGSEEFGGRLIPALAAFLAVLITYSFARRVFGSPLAGLLAGLILATSGEFLFMARWYRMDMPTIAAMWGAVWWFWRSEDRRLAGEPVSKMKTWLGFYLFAALATLFKGPAGLGLPGLVLTAYFLLSRQYRRIWDFFSPVGIAAYLLVAAPWYVAVGVTVSGYAKEFFLHQNLQRFAGSSDLGHQWPGILYIPIILAGMMPWTIFLPGIFIRYFPRRWRLRNDRPAMLFLWLCAIIPTAFFAMSSTKLASYVLPVFGPLAVFVSGLLSTWITSRQPDKLMKHGVRATVAIVAILPCVSLATEIWLKTASYWICIPFVVSLVVVVAMLFALKRPRRAQFAGWAVAAAVGTFIFLILHTAPPAYEQRMSVRPLALAAEAEKVQEGSVCFWTDTKLSFLFYSHIEKAKDYHYTPAFDGDPNTLETLVGRLESDQPVYCVVTSADKLTRLQSACQVQLRTVAKQGEYSLISNRWPKQP